MLTEELLYRNVEKGLKEAPLSLVEIYKDPFLRVVLEALILDGNRAPAKLYDDLFSISYEEADGYGPFFFDRGPFVSRIHYYNYLQGLPPGNDRAVKTRVFDEGWEALDLILNRGRNIVIEDVAKEAYTRATMYALGEVRTKLSEMQALTMTGDEVKRTMSTNMMKELLSVVRDGAKLFPKDTSDNKVDQLLFDFEQNVDANTKDLDAYHSPVTGMIPDHVGKIASGKAKEDPDYAGIIADTEDMKEVLKTKGNRRQSLIPTSYNENS